ncbi:MAG: nucleotidyltransferase domain-containing protein [Phycisphaerales bacterium]|nr:nucleotidyltransferase domain-containing protein [Phycisphaerales bacterium]
MPLSVDEFGPLRILPAGTRVVVRAGQPKAGSVGVITRSPTDATHHYRVRLVNGDEEGLRRSEFSVLREMQSAGLLAAGLQQPAISLERHIVYRCIVGSRAYGLHDQDSDTDVRGIFVPPAEAHWSLYGVPEQIECDETQECYWEIQKFLTLALKGNPNILECLYTPEVLHATDIGRELLEIRDIFLSRLIYQTYNGYVLSQFKKLNQDLRQRGVVRWKHAMHLIRLLLTGIDALREGVVRVCVTEHRPALLAIKRGETPWGDVDSWRVALHAEFEAAYASSSLPERPDYARANDLLIRARRWGLGA